MRQLDLATERFPIAGAFTIARGSKTEAAVVTCTIRGGNAAGRGECVPYARYGESLDGVMAAIEAVRPALERGAGRSEIARLMPAGAARNAVDCALWDLGAKQTDIPVFRSICDGLPEPLVTAYTLSLDTPEQMERQAAANAARPLLKVKVGQPGDRERIEAVRRGAPKARLILDANEGWDEAGLEDMLGFCAAQGVVLVEQPLPAGRDEALAAITRPVPVCADESLHTTADLERLRPRYDAVNVKLDKTGGLSEAAVLRDEARRLGFQIMVGCMVGTSLAMAPAVLLAQGADFVDLDGPLLLARDRTPGLTYSGSEVFPPEAALWG